MNVQKVVFYLHFFCVKLRTAQLLPALSLMAHAVQLTLAWELCYSHLDINEFVRMLFVFIY